MRDTTVKKVSSAHSPKGEMGQKYLASGKAVSMRLWKEEPGDPNPETERRYETVGYVMAGRAELHLEGQTVLLEAWDSWVVPKRARHAYRIMEPFTAVGKNRKIVTLYTTAGCDCRSDEIGPSIHGIVSRCNFLS
jgi:quercetin dioxygenase-like cupin family protein